MRQTSDVLSAEDASHVFVNGRVLSDVSRGTWADGLAVRGSTILAVGSRSEVMQHAGRRTRVWDLDGKHVLPGLIDTHIHQYLSAMDRSHVPLLDARSIADVAAAIGARTSATPGGDWVRARMGWHESLLAEGRLPTRHDLDPVSPDNPVFIPRGAHVAAVNSATLRLAGIDRDTPDPTGGVIVRDADGEPTGVLLESARELAQAHLPPAPTPEEQRRLLREQMAEHNALGITSTTDPGLTDAQFGIYTDLWHDGALTVRSRLLRRVTSLGDVEKAAEAFQPRSGDDWLRMDGFKYASDGGVEGAYLRDPYQIVPGEQTDPDYRGTMFLPPGGEQELADLYAAAARGGYQVQTHVVGDAAFEIVMDALQAADRQCSLAPHRFTIMHAFLPTTATLQMMRQLNVLATVQDHPVLLGRNQLRWWGTDRAHRAIPLRDIADAGILMGGGTDAPVVPANPFWSLWWMTSRRTLGGEVLGEEQALTPQEALATYTTGNAYVQFDEDRLGALHAGKLADLIIVDHDPLSSDPETLRNLQPDATMVDGEIVFER